MPGITQSQREQLKALVSSKTISQHHYPDRVVIMIRGEVC